MSQFHCSRRRRGSVITTMFVVVALGAFIAALLIPATRRSREVANRIKCANNLKQIGIALMLYANDNRGTYPRTKFEKGDTVIPDVTNGGADSANPFAPDTTVPVNCIPAAYFLLLRTEDIGAGVFVCPTSSCTPDSMKRQTAATRGNFSNVKENLSYSFANPYPDYTALASGYLLTSALDPGFALAADRNPGIVGGSNVLGISVQSTAAEVRKGNSRNHGRDGQNVLYADGHVDIDSTPMVGLNQDNIYCRGIGGPNATKDDLINSPKDKDDDVLLPADSD